MSLTSAPIWRCGSPAATKSAEALDRFLVHHGRPFLLADWTGALFFHYEIEPRVLRPLVPFELDEREGSAFVSLVAFTMRDLRFARGGRLSRWICRPLREQRFLNLRTYVRRGSETGIFFLKEWMSHWLCVQGGPLLFGLPYHHGRLDYEPAPEHGLWRGRVEARDGRGVFAYEACGQGAAAESHWTPCEANPLDDWLIERYSAFTWHRGVSRLFRIWHRPWLHTPVRVLHREEALLTGVAPWWTETRFIGANYSPGVKEVWMSMPRKL